MAARLREHYGSTPVHLLAHLIVLPLAAWALLQVMDLVRAGNVLLWLVGVFFPVILGKGDAVYARVSGLE